MFLSTLSGLGILAFGVVNTWYGIAQSNIDEFDSSNQNREIKRVNVIVSETLQIAMCICLTVAVILVSSALLSCMSVGLETWRFC